jgi:SHO1 osmosensor
MYPKQINMGNQRASASHIFGSPFFLATLSVALIGWIIAFASSIAADVNSATFSHFAWWAVMYELGLIIAVAAAILFNSYEKHKIALAAYAAVGAALSSSTCNALIYSDVGAEQAVAVGHIFLTIINLIWIGYFGSTPDSQSRGWVDGFASSKAPAVPDGPRPQSFAMTGRYTSPYPKTLLDPPPRSQQLTSPASASPATQTAPVVATTATGAQSNAPIGFDYRARAIYAYEANPEDPNEISFSKGEILEIADISGKWFQARNSKGEVGIAPSNYLTLIPLDS